MVRSVTTRMAKESHIISSLLCKLKACNLRIVGLFYCTDLAQSTEYSQLERLASEASVSLVWRSPPDLVTDLIKIAMV